MGLPLKHTFALFSLSLCLATSTHAQEISSFEKRITEKKLSNGLTVLLCERSGAPVVSFFTLVDTGSDRDVPGATGLAHMFEHMAFKGTERIGTTDFAKESVALQIEEDAYLAYDRERHKNVGRDENKIAELQKAWKAASESAERFVTTNEFSQIVKEHGGVDLNAFTTSEETGYLYSFPSNEIELWAYLESERLLHPVLREFYSEREVVHEERRLSYEEASGCLLQATNAIAAGGLHFPPLVLERYVQSAFSDRHSPHTMLTVRENQVMELAERRFSNKEIAAVLHIRCTTVRYHMSNIFSKLNISNRKMLVQRHEYDPNSGERAFDELRRVTLVNGAGDSNPGVSQSIIQRNTIRTSA